MSLRSTAVLTATVAVIAALLTASPAQARAHAARVTSTHIAISASGHGKVAVACRGNRQCRGTIWFARDAGSPRKRAYKVPAGRTSYVSVAMRTGSRDNPHRAPAAGGRALRTVKNVRLTVAERSPRRTTHRYGNLTTETRIARQQITGRVTGLGAQLGTDVHVELVRTLRGGNTRVVKRQAVPANGGTYAFSVNLGTNNGRSSSYLLRMTGRDQDGIRRSWYWRGASGRPTGGGAHVRDGSTVRATKWSVFRADFAYSSISGSTRPGAEVRVASPPPSYGGRTAQRELDIYRCANVFGRTTADASGAWTVGMLPATTSTNNRYMIAARAGRTQAWFGATDRRFGSCHDATAYGQRRGHLLPLTGPVTGRTARRVADRQHRPGQGALLAGLPAHQAG